MTQEQQTARPTRVLILDDDRVEGGMLAFHLRREGLVVMLMTSAEEASDAIAWAQPDVVLVEVAGRGFDGREFLAQLVNLPVDVYAVADRQLSSEVELDSLRLGVIDIMMKPVDPVTLARRLRSRPERQRRGSTPDLPEGGIAGDIAVHSAIHLLQMAHRHRLNARLHVEIDGDWAVLLVRHGEVIDAEAPSNAGREAAFQVMRATAGAFVLFPLAPDAEELSRDDVIRADLATLVADALGRKEPRSVNVLKEHAAFVLPHVGSPRGPLAKKGQSGGDETLEYAATLAAQTPRTGEAPRVKRPGERTQNEVELDAAKGDPHKQGGRHPTMTIAPVMLEAASGRSGPTSDIRRVDTLDESIFDEKTDQNPKEMRSGALVGVSNTGTHRRSTDRGAGGGLKRLQTNSQGLVQRGSGGGRKQKPTDPELGGASGERRTLGEMMGQRLGGRTVGGWSLITMVLAGAVAVLAIFIVWRLATKETPVPLDISGDPRLVLGQALMDLDEGKRDAARSALGKLAADPDVTSEVLSTLALLHYEDRRLVEAEALLERLAERDPRDPVTQAWLGLVQAERNDPQRAGASFARARNEASGQLAERLRRLAPSAGGASPGGTLAPQPQ